MTAPRVTYDDITRTANELTAQGQHPSAATVREALGRGSYSTINTHLKAWREQQEADALNTALPEAIEARYRKAAIQTWVDAKKLASEEFEPIQAKLTEERSQAINDRNTAEAEVVRLEQQLETLTGELEASQTREAELRETHAGTTARLTASEARVTELQKEVEALRLENKQLLIKIGEAKSAPRKPDDQPDLPLT